MIVQMLATGRGALAFDRLLQALSKNQSWLARKLEASREKEKARQEKEQKEQKERQEQKEKEDRKKNPDAGQAGTSGTGPDSESTPPSGTNREEAELPLAELVISDWGTGHRLLPKISNSKSP